MNKIYALEIGECDSDGSWSYVVVCSRDKNKLESILEKIQKIIDKSERIKDTVTETLKKFDNDRISTTCSTNNLDEYIKWKEKRFNFIKDPKNKADFYQLVKTEIPEEDHKFLENYSIRLPISDDFYIDIIEIPEI